MGAMCWREAMVGHATVVAVRRLLWNVFRAALVILVLAVVREILLDRAPQRPIPARGREPVIGSLDTWPSVPRKPATT